MSERFAQRQFDRQALRRRVGKRTAVKGNEPSHLDRMAPLFAGVLMIVPLLAFGIAHCHF